MRYVVLKNKDLNNLKKEIALKIDQGFAPWGDIFMDRDKDLHKIIMQDLSDPSIVNTKAPVGDRVVLFSHDLSDKTTWYADSISVVDESVGTGDGTTTDFNLANDYVIDLSHGKVTGEDSILPDSNESLSTYIPSVKVDSVVKAEREFAATDGGDYTIDYKGGVIKFNTPPASGEAITCSYFYSPDSDGSTMYFRPNDGKKLYLTTAEVMMTADAVFTDTVIASAFASDFNNLPNKVEVPGTRGVYKTVADLINVTNGSLPVVPAIGGVDRGVSNDVIQLRWEYSSTIKLDSDAGAELRVWTENHKELNAEHVNFSFYGFERDD